MIAQNIVDKKTKTDEQVIKEAKDYEKPFMQTLIDAGMITGLTESCQDILIKYTHEIAVLNGRLKKIIDIFIDNEEERQKLKKNLLARLLRWVWAWQVK